MQIRVGRWLVLDGEPGFNVTVSEFIEAKGYATKPVCLVERGDVESLREALAAFVVPRQGKSRRVKK